MMASNKLDIDVEVNLNIPDLVAERCLAVVAMWLQDHPDMTVRIERDGNEVKDVMFWRMK